MYEDKTKKFGEGRYLPPDVIKAIEGQKKLRPTCTHPGYSFETMGRCCFRCGAMITDFGD